MKRDGPPSQHEAEIGRGYEDLKEYKLADYASSVLAALVHDIAERLGNIEEPRTTAAVVGAIRAFRAVRCGMAILAVGYELEAGAMNRMLFELFVETQAAVEDVTGGVANAWLSGGRKRGIGARVAAAMPHQPDAYDQVSRAAHGDPRALLGLAVEVDGSQMIHWGPSRGEATTSCLVGFAVAARDMAVLLEDAVGVRFPATQALDRALARDVPGWAPDQDWGASVERASS